MKDIFKVSEFDVLREMGDKEPEELFGISGEKIKVANRRPEEEKKAKKETDEDQAKGGRNEKSGSTLCDTVGSVGGVMP